MGRRATPPYLGDEPGARGATRPTFRVRKCFAKGGLRCAGLDFRLWALDFRPRSLPSREMFVRFVKFWIVLSTLASVAGWTLSAVGMLNKTGYVIFAGVVIVQHPHRRQ